MQKDLRNVLLSFGAVITVLSFGAFRFYEQVEAGLIMGIRENEEIIENIAEVAVENVAPVTTENISTTTEIDATKSPVSQDVPEVVVEPVPVKTVPTKTADPIPTTQNTQVTSPTIVTEATSTPVIKTVTTTKKSRQSSAS